MRAMQCDEFRKVNSLQRRMLEIHAHKILRSNCHFLLEQMCIFKVEVNKLVSQRIFTCDVQLLLISY